MRENFQKESSVNVSVEQFLLRVKDNLSHSFAMFFDWLTNLALNSEPIRSEIKTNRGFLISNFGRRWLKVFAVRSDFFL